MGEFTRPVKDLAEDVKEYVNLRVDDVKLRAVKGLSISMSRLLSMIIVLIAASMAMFALSAGLILIVGHAIGSVAVGAFIVAAFFVIATLVLLRLKDRLFVNAFVKTLVGVFFDKEEE